MTPQDPIRRYTRPRGAYRRRPSNWSQRVTQTAAWANWRTQVFRRDQYRCVMCPDTPAAKLAFKASRRHLEPHHIIRKIDEPNRIHDVDNGVTLCNVCHAKVTDHEKDYEKKFQTYVRKLQRQEAELQSQLQDLGGLEI